MDWKTSAPILIALAGLIFGALTYWRSSRDRKTRLSVAIGGSIARPKPDGGLDIISCDFTDRAIAKLESSKPLLGGYPRVEIANQSLHAIYIDDVSFTNPRRPKAWSASITMAGVISPPGSMPYKLDPRQKVSISAPKSSLAEMLTDYTTIRVKTSDGHTHETPIPNLRLLRKIVRSNGLSLC